MDLSEIYIVRNVYKAKANNFLFRKGEANFSEGALAHDFINAAQMGGLMPESAYSGMLDGDSSHNHSELVVCLKGMLDALSKSTRRSPRWGKRL